MGCSHEDTDASGSSSHASGSILLLMSLEDAIGRIDQILQFQQRLQTIGPAGAAGTGGVGLAPATAGAATGTAATGTAATSGATINPLTAVTPAGVSTPATPSSALNATPQIDFATALASAQSAAAAQPAAALGAASASAAPPAVQAMISEANSLVGQPYVWGGGHSGWGPQSGYDCSGFVSAVLHAGGYLSTPQDTQTLPSATGIEPGPGQYVTIYDRTDGGSASNDHVIIDLAGQFYESGGETGPWGGGGGVQKIATPPPSYLATFNTVLHPAGL